MSSSITYERYAAVATAAQLSGKSINQWATETLGREVHTIKTKSITSQSARTQ